MEFWTYVACLRLESLFVMQRVYGLSHGLEQLWSLVDSHCQASLNQSMEYQYILTASIKEIQLKFTNFQENKCNESTEKGFFPLYLKNNVSHLMRQRAVTFPLFWVNAGLHFPYAESTRDPGSHYPHAEPATNWHSPNAELARKESPPYAESTRNDSPPYAEPARHISTPYAEPTWNWNDVDLIFS